MKYLAMILILITGVVLGRTYELNNLILKQDKCVQYVLKDDINLNQFFQENNSKTVGSIFIHAYAAVALKYNGCYWGQE